MSKEKKNASEKVKLHVSLVNKRKAAQRRLNTESNKILEIEDLIALLKDKIQALDIAIEALKKG